MTSKHFLVLKPLMFNQWTLAICRCRFHSNASLVVGSSHLEFVWVYYFLAGLVPFLPFWVSWSRVLLRRPCSTVYFSCMLIWSHVVSIFQSSFDHLLFHGFSQCGCTLLSNLLRVWSWKRYIFAFSLRTEFIFGFRPLLDRQILCLYWPNQWKYHSIDRRMPRRQNVRRTCIVFPIHPIKRAEVYPCCCPVIPFFFAFCVACLFAFGAPPKIPVFHCLVLYTTPLLEEFPCGGWQWFSRCAGRRAATVACPKISCSCLLD